MKNDSAQSGLEYLILIGGVVVVAMIAATLLFGIGSSSEQASQDAGNSAFNFIKGQFDPHEGTGSGTATCNSGEVRCGTKCKTPECLNNNDCDLGISGYTYTCENATTPCTAKCTSTPICANNDSQCPSGCTIANDNDCTTTPPICEAPSLDCPDECREPECTSDTGCDDEIASTKDTCSAPNTCFAQCLHTSITGCINEDGYCPIGCTNADDDDCTEPICGNGDCEHPFEDENNCPADCEALESCSSLGGEVCESFEVCEGEPIQAEDTYRCCVGECNLPSSFDWRDRHGENWLTSVKQQPHDSCFLYAALGEMEAHINLYYNEHLDINLSEQMLVDCSDDGGDSIDGYTEGPDGYIFNGFSYKKLKLLGVADEACDLQCSRMEYDSTSNPNCNYDNVCADWENRIWKIYDFKEYILNSGSINYAQYPYREVISTVDLLKERLITNGPMDTDIWGHGMVLIGYGIIEEGDTLRMLESYSGPSEVVGHESPYIGKTYWLFKNQWGESWGDNGYMKYPEEYDYSGETNLAFLHLSTGHLILPDQSYLPVGFTGEINCVDKDADDFCNWGITETKPPTCPVNCKDEKDWDDSDPTIGALGFNDPLD